MPRNRSDQRVASRPFVGERGYVSQGPLSLYADAHYRSLEAANVEMRSMPLQPRRTRMPTSTLPGGTYTLAEGLTVTRMGYGAMQLAGPHVFGPPADRDEAVAVLREAVEMGITHIDTSDYYGPFVTNEIIKEALYPYP